MDLNLKKKNALVCGSSRGIGKAVAFELAELGANVTLVSRSVDKLKVICEELKTVRGQKHDYMTADFNDSQSLKEKITILTQIKPIHILVNNTGGPPAGLIQNAEPRAFLEAFHNHLICNHILTQAVLEGMKNDSYGRIINIISTSVKQPLDNLGVSNTTRGAVASWAKTMANELALFNITVNNVLPGFTKTERLDEIIKNKIKKTKAPKKEVIAKMEQIVPLRRFADPSEIAAAVAFLASPAAGYINGINLPVDGGRTKSL